MGSWAQSARHIRLPSRVVEACVPYLWLAVPLSVFVASRLALEILSYTAQVLVPLNGATGTWQAFGGHRLLDGWARWDSGWYLLVAERGYSSGLTSAAPDGSVSPLYPFLIALLGRLLPIRAALVALILPNLAFGTALTLLYASITGRLGRGNPPREVLTRDQALGAILLLAFFPFGYFFEAAYADAFTLLLAVAAFALFERELYRPALALAALAALTTPAGLAVWPALAFGTFVVRRRPAVSRDGLVAALAPVMVLAFGGYLVAGVGAPLAVARSAILGPVRYGLIRDGLAPLDPLGFTFGSYALGLVIALALGLAGILLLRSVHRLLGATYAVFAVLVILRPLVGGLDGLGRDLAVAFPLFVAAGWRLRSPRALSLALVTSALFLGLLTALFASWYPTDRLSPAPSPSAADLRLGNGPTMVAGLVEAR